MDAKGTDGMDLYESNNVREPTVCTVYTVCTVSVNLRTTQLITFALLWAQILLPHSQVSFES